MIRLVSLKVLIAFLMLNYVEVVIADKIEFQVKAAYLYQFTKFTEWPNNRFISESDPIRICILGKSPFGKLLDNLSNRKSQNRFLIIEYLDIPKNISHCHVVYISKSEEKKLKQILQLTEHTSVLTVSDMINFAHRGGIIGLVVDSRKVRIEINFGASSQAGIKLSSKLLEIATLITN